MAEVGLGPALIELDEEERVFEGAAVDNVFEQVEESDHQAADQEERDERAHVPPDDPHPVPQPRETTLFTRMGGTATETH